MADEKRPQQSVKKFSPMFWLVIMFEFFERGSYYGMMSILSVYLTEHLHFAKESVGLIKGTIQPLLYFLPIISGALADRFGYRKMLMFAFSFLGLGYFLTAQATDYALVFGALVVMGFGAGTFKPIISGTIARVTDEKNSTLGFGIYYWSINLGAFLFPLILVPVLKKMNWSYVIIAAAIGTAAMLIPTLFFYKEPERLEKKEKANQTNIIQTLANAFEIIYSPVVLLYHAMKKTAVKRAAILIVLFSLFGYALNNYLQSPVASGKYSTVGIQKGATTVILNVDRNMLSQNEFRSATLESNSPTVGITVYKPRLFEQFAPALLDSLHRYPDLQTRTAGELQKYINMSDRKVELNFVRGETQNGKFAVTRNAENSFMVVMDPKADFDSYKQELHDQLTAAPI
ncbi:MAG: MFS transporter, partial [Calditrichia bacterium]